MKNDGLSDKLSKVLPVISETLVIAPKRRYE
jgi:hypothetical protein